MGIINTLIKEKKNNGIFAVIAGTRTSGKSTISGTLPGKTLMLQAHLLETGSSSAKKLASRLNNDLTIISFKDYDALMEILKDEDILKYDNIYIDGLSAITEQLFSSPEIKKHMKKNIWDGFRELWIKATNLLLHAKELSDYINVFFTLAIREKFDRDGNLIAIEPETKGNATIGEIKHLCPTILYTIAETFQDEDTQETTTYRSLITGYQGLYAGRIDTLLDQDNPGKMEADLSKVIQIIKEEEK